MVEYRVSDKLILETDDGGELAEKPYHPSVEKLQAHVRQKVNEAVDKIAADNGISRDEVLDNARKILTMRDNNRLRDYLAMKPGEEAETIGNLLKKCEDK